MPDVPDPTDPLHLRISDADRHQVSEALRTAAGEGRLDIDELEERLEAAYAAKTYADLVPLTLDLPGVAPAAHLPAARQGGEVQRRTPAGVQATYDTSVAVMGECRRSGVWDLGEHHTAFALMGSVVIDLREARFPAGEVVLDANALMGSVEVLVDETVDVRVEGFGLMGSYQENRSRVLADVDASSPRVRLRGVALMGSVEVKRKAVS